MQAISNYPFPAQTAQIVPLPTISLTVRVIDVYEPENLGLEIFGPISSKGFDYIRAAYEQRLRLTAYPYLYLELHHRNRTSPQQIWDDLTQELKMMGDFYRIAIVRSAAAAVDTAGFGAPGVIIQQFSLANAEAAKQWLI